TAASGTSSPPKPRAGRPQDQVRGTTRPARSQTRHTADARRYDWDHDGMRRHRAAATLLTLGLTLAATACGGGNDDGPPAATEPPADNADTETAALEDSVRAYTKALFEPDPDTAYDL